MLWVALLCGVSANYFFTWDNKLSPLDIYWPNWWVDNLISLSTNHAGAKNTTITINCNIQADLPVGTYIEVTIPGFGSPPYTYSIILTKAQLFENDNTFTFTSIDLPYIAGVYGPISLIAMQGKSGQIIASSVTFGFVGITTALPLLSYEMTVNFASDASKVIYEATSLEFNIKLNVSLQAFDYIIVSIDKNFEVGVLTGPIWSLSDSETEKLFNTTQMSYVAHTYDAGGSVSTQGSFMIYGLQQSININSNLIFRISGFYNPKFVGSTPTWTAEFMRWGTRTVLQRVSGAGPAANIPGTVTGTWVPTNGYLTTSQILPDAVLYMTLAFSTEHTIPKDGTIEIEFTNAILKHSNIGDSTQSLESFEYGEIFIDYSPFADLSCAVIEGKKIKCLVTATIGIKGGNIISIYNIVTFGLGNSIIDIATRSGTHLIDYKAGIVSQAKAEANIIWLLPETIFQFHNNKVYMNKPINTAAAGGDLLNLYVDFMVFDSLLSGWNVNLKFPVTNSIKKEDTMVSFFPEVYMMYKYGGSAIYEFSYSNMILTNVSIGTNLIQVALDAYGMTGMHYSMLISAGTILNPGVLYLPFFASSKGTRYEALISYTNANNQLRYYSKPIGFEMATISDFNVKAVCLTAPVPLMPVQIMINPGFNYNLTPGIMVYFDLDFHFTNPYMRNIGSNFGTGLATGAIYPSDLSSGSIILLAKDEGHLLYSPLTEIKTVPIVFVVPMPNLGSSGVLSAGITLFANRTLDGKIFKMARLVPYDKITATDIKYTSSQPLYPNYFTAGTFLETIFFPSTASSNDYAIAATTVVFILEQGWTFSNYSTIKIGIDFMNREVSSVKLTILTSSDPNLRWSIGYKTSYVYKTPKDFTIGASLSGVTATWYSSYESLLYFVSGKPGGDFASTSNSICDLVSIGSARITSALMKPIFYSPLNSEGYGVNVQTVNLVIALLIPGTVYAGSTFTATIANEFSAHGCKCTFISEPYSHTSKVIGNTCSSSSISLKSNIAPGSIVSITVFGVKVPIITVIGTVKNGFTSVIVDLFTNSYPAASEYMSFTDSIDGSDFKTRTTFSVGVTTAGTSKIIDLNVFPNSIGAKSAHLKIKFTLSHSIPFNAKITFTGENFLNDFTTKYSCWLSVGYSEVTISGKSITFTINQSIPAGLIVEMRKYKAFNIPSTPAETWLISVGVFNSIDNIIMDNLYTNLPKNKLYYAKAPIFYSHDGTLTPSVTNMYFESIHNFKFIPGVDIFSSTLIVFEAPYEYDAHLGSFYVISSIPSYFWIHSKSLSSPGLACSVDHWHIICSGLKNISATDTLDISLSLTNPNSISVSWNIFVMTSNLELLTNGLYGIIGDFTALPSRIIDLYNITHDTPAATHSNHKILIKLPSNVPAGSSIMLDFPSIYNLEIYNPVSISCEAWINTTTGLKNLVPSDYTCPVNGNTVLFNNITPGPSENLITLKLNEVVNPLSGLKRETGLDVTSILFTNYDFWSNKFLVFSYTDASSKTVSSMSADNLNAGYTGFFKKNWLSISVNKGKTLSAIPGTMSKLYSLSADTDELRACKLTLVASDTNGDVLKFDSEYYSLTIERPVSWFRVGLSSSASFGLYYITWTIAEVPLATGVLLYKPPGKTLVEVPDIPRANVEVIVDPILNISPVYGSFPIAISLTGDVTPFSDLSISFENYGSANFSFTPASLTFKPGESVKHFSIQIRGNATNGQFYNLLMTLSGNDSASYFPVYKLQGFTVGSLYTAPAVVKAYLSSSSKISAVLSLDTNSHGIATWALYSTSVNDSFLDYEWVASRAAPASGEPSEKQRTVHEQIKEWNIKISKIDQSDWIEYSMKVLLLAKSMIFCGQQYVPVGDKQIIVSLNNLVAQTTYIGIVWFDNLSGQPLSFSHAIVTTSALDYPIKISLSFADTIEESNASAIGLAISQTLFLQPSRVNLFSFTKISRQISTSMTFLLLPSPTSEKICSDIVTSLNTGAIFTNVKKNYVEITSAPTVEYSVVSPSAFGFPSLDKSYWNNTHTGVMKFEFTAEVDGFACCAYQFNNPYSLTSENLYLGINEKGENIEPQKQCWSVESGKDYAYNFNFSRSQIYGKYTLSCTACNSYPILPVCLVDSFIPVETFVWANITSFACLAALKISILLAF